jgi:hypothetical protein
MAQAPLIKLAPQLNFMWDELQGPENRTMRMFEANPNMGPGQYASLFEKMYERAGGAGDEIAQKYAQDVYSAMQDPVKAEGLPPNAKFAYGYLTQKGMTPQQAAGITGRLMVESYPRIDPSARNTMGGGAGTLGVAQWRGPRLEALAKSAGVSMDDIRALPSSTPEGNYYSQTGSGGDKMANGLLNMMPGAAPEQEQAQPQPQGGGFKNFVTNPDFLDTLAIGLGGMTMRPNTGVIEAAQSRMKNRAASRQDAQIRNKTAEWLRANGREDLAGAVESGSIDGKTAVTLAYQEPKDKGQIVSAEQMRGMFPGTTIEDGLYNLKPDGTANKVGGGGTTINMPGGEAQTELQKKLAGQEADILGKYLTAGNTASVMKNDLLMLEEILQYAPQDPITGRLAQMFPGVSSAGAAAQSIINRVAPSLRVEGSGSTSDIEYEGMLRSLVSLMNYPEANNAILGMMLSKAQIDIDRKQIVRDFQNSDQSAEAAREMRSRLSDLDKRSIMTPELSQLLARTSGSTSGSGTSGGVNWKVVQ